MMCYLLTGHQPYWMVKNDGLRMWLECRKCGHETPGVQVCEKKQTAA